MFTQTLFLRFLPVILLWLLLGIYTGYRLISPLTLRRTSKIILWSVWLVLVILPLLTMIFSRGGTEDVHPFLQFLPWPGFLALGIVSIVFVLAFLRDLVLGLEWLFRRFLAN